MTAGAVAGQEVRSTMDFIRATPITGPKAWRGAALTSDPSWVVTLDEPALGELDRALAHARSTGRALADIGREDFPLARTAALLGDVLDEIQGGRGFVVLRGLPVERYSDEDVGLLFWGIGRHLGSPLYQNPQGDLLGHVYDHGRTYGNIDVRGYESNAYLPYHTDGCDLVGLLCLRRGVEGGLSSIVSSSTVHNEILEHHREYLGLLYNGFYYIRREEALTTGGVSERPIPVFGCRDGVVSCRYIRNQINAGAVKRGVPLTRIERAALDCMDELTRRPDLRLDMDLRAGDIQLCNNYTILHSRTEFRDGPEPHQKRHMLRLWLKFPRPWPIAEEFPDQVGYQPAAGAKALVEA
jgi:hypothetical protein